MVGTGVFLEFGLEDASLVVLLQIVGGLDTAANGSESINLSLHLSFSGGVSVRVDRVKIISLRLDAVLGHELSKGGWDWGRAISADVFSSAGAAVLNVVLSSILLAGNMRHTVVVDILDSGVRLSSVAAVVLAVRAVDENLSSECDGRSGELSVISDGLNVESVGHGRGHALSPAGSTVVRNVLVLVPGKIVDSFSFKDIGLRVSSPVKGLGDVSFGFVEHGLLLGGQWWWGDFPSLFSSSASLVRLVLHETGLFSKEVWRAHWVFSVSRVVC